MAALRVFTVHERTDKPMVLVREGFSWPALFFGWIWLVAHGALLAAIVLLAVWIGLSHVPQPAFRVPLIVGLVSAQGVFGADLWRLSLGWRGYRQTGVALGPDREAALLRLADRRAVGEPAVQPIAGPVARPWGVA